MNDWLANRGGVVFTAMAIAIVAWGIASEVIF